MPKTFPAGTLPHTAEEICVVVLEAICYTAPRDLANCVVSAERFDGLTITITTGGGQRFRLSVEEDAK